MTVQAEAHDFHARKAGIDSLQQKWTQASHKGDRIIQVDELCQATKKMTDEISAPKSKNKRVIFAPYPSSKHSSNDQRRQRFSSAQRTSTVRLWNPPNLLLADHSIATTLQKCWAFRSPPSATERPDKKQTSSIWSGFISPQSHPYKKFPGTGGWTATTGLTGFFPALGFLFTIALL